MVLSTFEKEKVESGFVRQDEFVFQRDSSAPATTSNLRGIRNLFIMEYKEASENISSSDYQIVFYIRAQFFK